MNNLSYSKVKLSKWAEAYEREHGKIYCKERVENNKRRAQGKKVNVHADLVTQLYNEAGNGRAFEDALSKNGFKLAQGRGQRILLIDSDGVVFNLARRVDGAKTKDIRAKLEGVGLRPLADFVEQLEVKRKKASPEPFDRDAQYQKFQDADIDAAIAQVSDPQTRSDDAPTSEPPATLLKQLQDKHLAELGEFYTKIHDSRERLEASLEQRYGPTRRQLNANIAELEGVLKTSNRVSLFIRKMLRQIPPDPEATINSWRSSLVDVGRQTADARQQIESSIGAQRHAIQIRHQREREILQSNYAPNLEVAYDPCIIADQSDADEDIGPVHDL